ncbi:hypothetical protein VTP01DRAFT_9973 [Rhizomucor pusillus]|uniref:uncharacterized protein n=1 Tax=Rhizomucor pusillus TaxID=4840 RepID=UPI00374276BC
MSQAEPMEVDQHDQRIRCTIPQRIFAQIDYPGNVRNIDRALETLGGEKEISNALEHNEESLKLNYRPNDPFSHAINGTILPHSGLAVKITRRKKKNRPEEEATYSAEILGTVVKICRFRALSDFQYIVPQNDPIRQLRTAMDKGDGNVLYNFRITNDYNSIPFQRIPPPQFCVRQAPNFYRYQQNSPVVRVKVRLRDGSYAIRLVSRKPNETFSEIILAYNDPAPTSSPLPMEKMPIEERQVAEKVAKLFEERPIWPRLGIKTHLEVKEYRFLRRALVANAYTFRSGPWRECWIKYGVDPRTDPMYNIYQNVDARRIITGHQRAEMQHIQRRRKPRFLPDVPRASEAAHESKGQNVKEDPDAYIFDGLHLRPSVNYLLCDITDPDVTPIINNPKYLKSTWTKLSGWYYSCAYERLRMVVRKKLEELTKHGSASPYPNILDGLDELVEKEKVSDNDETNKYEVIDEENGVEQWASQAEAENQENEIALRMMESMQMLKQTQGIGEDMEDFDALEEYDIDELLEAEAEAEEEDAEDQEE